MGGKRAKPSPWRFLRGAPVVIVAVVVWVMVGLFLLLPGPGSDQAHEWGLDPIPSSSDDEVSPDPDASSSASPDASTPGTATAGEAATAREPVTASGSATAEGGRSPGPTAAGDLELSAGSAAPAHSAPTSSPPTDPAPRQAEPGPPTDNPGKKKGHHKRHGPQGDRS